MRSLWVLALIGALATPAAAEEKDATPPPPAAAGRNGAAAIPAPPHPAPEEVDLDSVESLLEESPPGMQERWYGWQTLATDGASLLFVIAAGATADSGTATAPLAAISLLGYLLGGPVVHLAHENPGRAAGSLALRAGLPIAAGFVGSQLEDCSNGGGAFCGVSGAVIGGLLGIVGAVTIDASVLAREHVPVDDGGSLDVGVSVGRDRAFVVTSGSF